MLRYIENGSESNNEVAFYEIVDTLKYSFEVHQLRCDIIRKIIILINILSALLRYFLTNQLKLLKNSF